MVAKTENLSYPTEFTLEQLERLRELAMRASSVSRTPEDHNLGVKLANYVDSARIATHRQLRVVS